MDKASGNKLLEALKSIRPHYGTTFQVLTHSGLQKMVASAGFEPAYVRSPSGIARETPGSQGWQRLFKGEQVFFRMKRDPEKLISLEKTSKLMEWRVTNYLTGTSVFKSDPADLILKMDRRARLREILADEGLSKKADKIRSRGLRTSLSHADSLLSSVTRDLQELRAVVRKLEDEALEYQGYDQDLVLQVEEDAQALKGLVKGLWDQSSEARRSAQALLP